MLPSSVRQLALSLTKTVYHEGGTALGVLAMEIVDFAINAAIIATNQERSMH